MIETTPVSGRAIVLARTRSFALNIIRHNGIKNVAQPLWNGALRLDTILEYDAI